MPIVVILVDVVKPLNRIQYKLLIAFLIVVLLPLIGTGLYGNRITSRVLQNNALDNAKNEAALQAEQINSFLDSAEEDILFLSELGSVQSLVAAQSAGNQERIESWLRQVQSDFTTFSKQRKIYYQIRYLTGDGREFIRIESGGRAPRPVAKKNLQDKSNRYYFQETIQLNKGDVFVSPLDLNRERGAIELPYKPVIRYATPVFDDLGIKHGIVVVNIFADKFLNIIRQAGNEYTHVSLVDKDGYYLVNPDAQLEWGSPTDLATGQRLQNDYPAQSQKILSGQPGQNIENSAVVYIPIYPNPDDSSFFWVIVHDEPQDTIFASVWNFRVAAASILVLASVIAVVIAVWLARSLAAPIRTLRRGVEKFGRGELTELVPITTNDEIGELSNAFNEMAVALNKSKTQRQNLLEQLIHVQEEERRMVAYDIHDGLIQRLVGARLQLSNFIAQRRNRETAPAEQSLQRGIEHLSSSIAEGRRLIEGLRPAMLDDLGLTPALKELSEQIASEMQCNVKFSSDLSKERLPAPIETTAYRIVQEALSNSRKHSQTQHLQVELKQKNGCLEITVQDWGVGFDTSNSEPDHNRIGLTSMQERASLVGGKCEINSEPGYGTIVKSSLPVKPVE